MLIFYTHICVYLLFKDVFFLVGYTMKIDRDLPGIKRPLNLYFSNYALGAQSQPLGHQGSPNLSSFMPVNPGCLLEVVLARLLHHKVTFLLFLCYIFWNQVAKDRSFSTLKVQCVLGVGVGLSSTSWRGEQLCELFGIHLEGGLASSPSSSFVYFFNHLFIVKQIHGYLLHSLGYIHYYLCCHSLFQLWSLQVL